MGIAKIRIVITLTAANLIASCTQHHVALEAPLKSDAAIIFHNQGHDRIQVYLIGETQERLLGRLEALETARLQLPEWLSEAAPGAVRLAVIPGWSKDLRPSLNGRAIFSIKEFRENLPGEEWTFVGGQLMGPWRGQHPGHFRYDWRGLHQASLRQRGIGE
jgi:hypothetical protein